MTKKKLIAEIVSLTKHPDSISAHRFAVVALWTFLYLLRRA